MSNIYFSNIYDSIKPHKTKEKLEENQILLTTEPQNLMWQESTDWQE